MVNIFRKVSFKTAVLLHFVLDDTQLFLEVLYGGKELAPGLFPQNYQRKVLVHTRNTAI